MRGGDKWSRGGGPEEIRGLGEESTRGDGDEGTREGRRGGDKWTRVGRHEGTRGGDERSTQGYKMKERLRLHDKPPRHGLLNPEHFMTRLLHVKLPGASTFKLN